MTTDNTRDKILDSTVRQLWEGSHVNDDTLNKDQLLTLAAYWVQVADILKDAANEVRRSAAYLRYEAKKSHRRPSADIVTLRAD